MKKMKKILKYSKQHVTLQNSRYAPSYFTPPTAQNENVLSKISRKIENLYAITFANGEFEDFDSSKIKDELILKYNSIRNGTYEGNTTDNMLKYLRSCKPTQTAIIDDASIYSIRVHYDSISPMTYTGCTQIAIQILSKPKKYFIVFERRFEESKKTDWLLSQMM